MAGKQLARQVETKFFHFSATGLRVEGEPDYDAWTEYGVVLGKLKDGCAWGIGDWVNYGEAAYGEKYSQALDVTGRSEGGLRNLAWVASRFDVSRRRETLGWSLHAEVASLEPAEADALLDEVERDGLTREAVRERLKTRRHAERTIDRAWPTGTYGVILADFPWRYKAGVVDPTRSVENQYPTMTLEEILALGDRVREVAAKDCILLSWVTMQMIPEYVAIVDGWGFTHQTGGVWVKDSEGMGWWFRQRHELLCLATIGSPAAPLEQARPDSVIERPRRAHSEKPSLYAMFDVMFPGVPKLELFARANPDRPDAWVTWGNEDVGPRLVRPEPVALGDGAPA